MLYPSCPAPTNAYADLHNPPEPIPRLTIRCTYLFPSIVQVPLDIPGRPMFKFRLFNIRFLTMPLPISLLLSVERD